MKKFCSVRLTKDKKGIALFSDKPNKVKRDHIEIIPATAIEMPSQDNLKPVDDLEPGANLLNYIDSKLIEESTSQNVQVVTEEEVNTETGEVNPNLMYDVKDVMSKKNAIIIDEKGVESVLPTIDDAINLRDENHKLKLQIEALVGWQSHASAECAKFRKDYMDLKKEFDVSINNKKEELLALIKNM